MEVTNNTDPRKVLKIRRDFSLNFKDREIKRILTIRFKNSGQNPN
jgi:hypothetical protein